MFCCRLLTADAQKSYLYYRLPGPLPASIGYRYRYRLVTSSYRSYYLDGFASALVLTAALNGDVCRSAASSELATGSMVKHFALRRKHLVHHVR